MALIKGISSYLPSNKLTNQNLADQFPDFTPDKVYSKLGINERRISADESISDMSIKACENLFETTILTSKETDFILLCTQSPDYILPTTACVVQSKLGIPTNSGALDFNQGCSGYIYGLALAKGLVESGIAKNLILITSEAYSKHIHPLDKSNKSIFGDGATATWIGADGDGFKIDEFVLGTDGNGSDNLIIKNGGSKSPKKNYPATVNLNGGIESDDHLYMNGAEIFNFTLKNIPSLIDEVLRRNQQTLQSIDTFVFHQANAFMLEHLRKKIGIDKSKFVVSMENVGNTVSSTIPLALESLIQEKNIGNKILLAGFGVGYSWGGVVLSKHKG
jgi:3-oxoacyl-[acyl-carrier-protein] synthase-3